MQSLGLALAAGTLAAVNPCGFALLPAYLTLLVVQGADGTPLRRAFRLSGAMTAGFVGVFGAFGLVVVPLALRVERYLPWVTVAIGIALVGLGAWLLAGRQLVLAGPHVGRGPSGSLASMLVYGAGYAVASLSCTAPVFLAVVASTFAAGGLVDGLAVFVAYALGMGLVVTTLAVAVALAREGAVARVRRLLPYVNRVSGALLVVAGAYVCWYGVHELRVLAGDLSRDPVVDGALEVQGSVARWLSELGAWPVLAALGLLVAAGLAGSAVRRNARR